MQIPSFLPTLLLLPSLLPFTTPSTLPLPLTVSPDPRFTTTLRVTPHALPSTSALMHAVSLSATLAFLNFSSSIIDFPRTTLPSYPGMAIEIEPAAKVLGVPVRFVLWGLMRWVWVMCERKRFWVGEVGLMWEGWSVGWVKFVKVGELPGEVGRGREAGEGQGEAGLLSLSSLLAARGGSVADRVHHNNIINPTTTTTTIATTATAAHIQKSGNTTTTTTTDFTLKTAYLPSARPVSIFQLFLTVLATLHAVAPFPTTPGARPKGRTDFFSHDLKVKLEFVGPGGPEGGVEWRWIIEVMRLLPEVMLGRGKFAEVAFLMLVDGEREEVGNGVLWVNEGVGVSS